MKDLGWIGVDLDKTLARYEGWKGADFVGEPIPAMLKRVQGWLKEGREVRIFTARVSHDGSQRRMLEASLAHAAIETWCLKHLGRVIPVTNVKDYRMQELWDDRAVQVVANTGIAMQEMLDSNARDINRLEREVHRLHGVLDTRPSQYRQPVGPVVSMAVRQPGE